MLGVLHSMGYTKGLLNDLARSFVLLSFCQFLSRGEKPPHLT